MDTKNRCCCGCCSLKTGTITIGVLGIVCSTLILIGCLVGFTITTGAVYRERPNVMPGDELAVIIVMFLTVFTELILCVLLVYGAVWEKPCFMIPWLYYSIVCLIILVVALAVLIVMSFIYGQIAVAWCTLILAFGICIGKNSITVVTTYYLQLKDTDQPPLPAEV